MSAAVKTRVAPFQAEFLDISYPAVRTIVGAKGSGKTVIGARFVVLMVDSLPGKKGIFASPTNRQTEDIWDQNIQSLLDDLRWQYDWNKSKGIVRFANGSVLHLRSAESPTRIESIEYAWGWQEETSLTDQEFSKTVKSRVRALSGTGHMRFTTMPDDPESYIYDYIERVSDSFAEVTLYDNPNKKFVIEYEKHLKSIYTGAELDRLLNAKRVSLTGLNLFNISNSHKKELEYQPKEDLFFCWDFNVIYRAVTAWQPQGKVDGVPVLGCIRSYQMNESTTYEDAVKLANEWKKHKARVYLHGDASGDNRTASTSRTMWQQVRKAFKEQFGGDLRYIVPNSNPPVKDTIQQLNWALTNDKMYFGPKAAKAFRSVSAAKADRYGEIDKKMDDSPDGANTHEADTVRYMANHIFKRYLPGSQHKIKRIEVGGI